MTDMSDGNKYDYDLIIIGGGSGGLAACKEAACFDKKIAIIDFVVPSPMGSSWGIGGTCTNVGCVPKKLMHRATLLDFDIKDASVFGWEFSETVKHSWTKLISNIQDYIKSVNFGYRALLKEKGVTYLNAYAEFIDPHTIKTTDKKKEVKQITSALFIIAVGARPCYPDIPGAKEFGITSDDLFSLLYCPGKTLIVGASYVGLECAGILNGLGLDCSIMVRSQFLRGFDQQMANLVADHLVSLGVKVIKGCTPTRIKKISGDKPARLQVTGQDDKKENIVGEYDTVLFAVGREASTKQMGLENIGVKLNPENGKVICNDREQSSMSNIYAIGDCIDDKPNLTPVAVRAGKLLVQRLFNKSKLLTDYNCVPTTIFTPLEYGCVGLSEEDAIKKYNGNNIEVYHGHFQPLEFALPSRNSNVCYGKLICNKKDGDRVVGLHVFGPNAGEITQGFAIGLKMGAKKADFNSLVGIHPTCAEAFTTMDVTKASGKSIMKTVC